MPTDGPEAAAAGAGVPGAPLPSAAGAGATARRRLSISRRTVVVGTITRFSRMAIMLIATPGPVDALKRLSSSAGP